ncbi:MAG TPA: hypothetical protein VLX68_06490 [Chitinivibrionales bacterium]|nr:hypothetical protein [Chitinivibrionales bacterium]
MSFLSIPVFIMAGITLYVGINNFLFWFRMREKVEQFLFSGLCASVAVYDVFSALLYGSQHLETSMWFQRGQYSAIACTSVWTVFFVLKSFRQKLTPFMAVLLGIYVTYIFIAWINSPLLLHLSLGVRTPTSFMAGPLAVTYLELRTGPMILALFGFVFLGIVVSYAYFMRGYRQYRDWRFLLVQASLTVFFLAVVNDILLGGRVLKSIYLVEYSFLAVILVMDYFMQRDYVFLYNKEKEYAQELELKVKERTRDLEDSLAHIKTLSGLIPICASCKKVRDDRGYWQQVEEYISEHTEAGFSHGICPDCMKKMYPEQYEKFLARQKQSRKQGVGGANQGPEKK